MCHLKLHDVVEIEIPQALASCSTFFCNGPGCTSTPRYGRAGQSLVFFYRNMAKRSTWSADPRSNLRRGFCFLVVVLIVLFKHGHAARGHAARAHSRGPHSRRPVATLRGPRPREHGPDRRSTATSLFRLFGFFAATHSFSGFRVSQHTHSFRVWGFAATHSF